MARRLATNDWGIVVSVIAVLDPDSIDPGEPLMFVAIFGPMGLLTGIAFGILLTIREHLRGRDTPPVVTTAWLVMARRWSRD